MDKNEVITLSSDEESDITHRFEDSKSSFKPGLKNSPEVLSKCLEKLKNVTVNKKKCVIILNRKQGVQGVNLSKVPEKKQKLISKECPEVVDLESSEKAVEDEEVQIHCTNNKSPNISENHSNLDVIDIDEIPNGDNTPVNNEINKPDVTSKDVSKLNNVVPVNIQTDSNERRVNEGSDKNLKFFTEFVECCGCLEEIPNDRIRLTKKLMKRYGEADSNYIKSEEFRRVIEKCRNKVSKNNLYLIAKEITDELTYRKQIDTGKSNLVKETSQRDHEITVTGKVQESTKKSKKRTKVIKKVIKKLDKLGCKIRDLEEQEVDLSDEEESTYVQLQRCRERFWQIYTKLCKYTNDVTDADGIYSRKICFTESKYPAINRCIENWLNKTKRFPDFSDIMKLLESQSGSLGLPSNRESIRAIAIEIFQAVGAMLQRRRKYDLWDSFCGFLDDGEDPAAKDPLLDRVLKNNYETRIKKEQEIFKHFADLQEKERLEPEEVSDGEANRSPVESGNEDDKEIEEIENSLNKRLDETIRKETEEIDVTVGNGQLDECQNGPVEPEKTGGTLKESKNNFRNCKSLKWRLENGVKGKSESANSEDSTTGPETEKDTRKKAAEEVDGVLEEVNSGFDAEVTAVKDTKPEFCNEVKMEATGCADSPLKRPREPESEDGVRNKRKRGDKENDAKEVDIFEVDCNSEVAGKDTSEVFQVHCCQVFASNAFEELSEKDKDWGKRKVFRDLTNVGRLMERKRKTFGLFFPSPLFHRGFFEFEKPSWKKRFKVSYKLVGLKGQKCALNQDEKSGETVNPDSGGDKKSMEKSSEGAGEHEDGDNAYSGRGNGSEGDNNEDENKRNGRTGDEVNENQHEEDEEDEETEKEEDGKAEAESAEHSLCVDKTEEQSDGDGAPSESLSSREEKREVTNEESLPTGADVGFEKEKQVEETPPTDSSWNKETEVENEEEERRAEDRAMETPETGKEGTELLSGVNNCEASEFPEAETEAVENKTIEGINPEVQNNDTECGDREANLDECSIAKSEEETTEVEAEEESLTKQVEEIEHDSTTQNEEAVETDGVTQKEDATKADTKSEEAAECNEGTTENEEPAETESTDETAKIEVKESQKESTRSEIEMPNNTYPKVDSQSSILDTQISTPRKRVSRENAGQKSVDKLKSKPAFATTETRGRRKPRETSDNKLTIIRRPVQMEPPVPKLGKRNAPSTSDEEIVKRFLLHSPSSISITPPRKLALSKPPSEAAMQALATLRNLKGISATIVRGGKPKSEDDVVVIGGSYRRRMEQNSNRKRRQTDLPVISNVQSVGSTTPKIVTVQGNVSGFDSSWPDDGNSQCNSSSIRISNVWGSLPNSFMQSRQNSEAVTPGCSSRQNNPGSSRKKNAKKTVEYVVLE